MVVVDYGMGNLFSVASALRYLGANPTTSANPDDVVGAKRVILPGVGSFRRAMEELRRRGLDEAIRTAAAGGSEVLGICLGMQLLARSSTEDGLTDGLGLIDAAVEAFPSGDWKIPHVGYSPVLAPGDSRLFASLGDRPSFYFVHSFRVARVPSDVSATTCDYGGGFVAAFESGNVAGTQFHPEKSQSNGLVVLANFLRP